MAPTTFLTPPHPQTASSGGPSNSASRLTSSTASLQILPSSSESPATTATSIEFLASPSSWKPRKKPQPLWKSSHHNQRLCSRAALRWLILILCLTLAVSLYRTLPTDHPLSSLPDSWLQDTQVRSILQPTTHTSRHRSKITPEEWIRTHSHPSPPTSHPLLTPSRPRAALISLVRNSELSGILQSIKQLEYHFNRHHHYPWIFFSDAPFTAAFIAATSNATSSHCHYELIPHAHWSTPSWVDENRFMDSLDYLGTIGVGKGWMVSYRHMCRWNSGFFYKHPALKDYDYYWRVEPDVHFYCAIPYDPFAFFAAFGLIYGFNMAILEDARSFPSLWPATLAFIAENPGLVHPDADVGWLLDASAGGGYNGCQFFSNFEIGDLRFFRGQGEWAAATAGGGAGGGGGANEKYFEYLDRLGGFYYERFGDAPIHTLSVSLFAPRERVWFFRDVGYQHDVARHCPGSARWDVVGGEVEGEAGRCACEPTRLDENFYKLVPMESPQRKPRDTCVRMWLDGEWLRKKEGWDREAELALGGDGFGGYAREG